MVAAAVVEKTPQAVLVAVVGVMAGTEAAAVEAAMVVESTHQEVLVEVEAAVVESTHQLTLVGHSRQEELVEVELHV